MSLIKDNDFTIRFNVAKILTKLNNKTGIETLVTYLKRIDTNIALEIINILIKSGNKNTITEELLLKVIEEIFLSKKLSYGLRGYVNKGKTTETRNIFLSNDGIIPIYETVNFSQISHHLINPTTKLIKNNKLYIQEQAIFLLAYLGHKKSLNLLVNMLKNQEFIVRSYAVQALGELGAKQTMESLILLLKYFSIDVRKETLGSLNKLGAKKAIGPLITLLKDSDIQTQAKKSLELLNNSEILLYKPKPSYEKPQQNIQQLFKSLEDNNSIHVQKQAIKSLGKISPNASKENKTKIQEKLAAIASNQQELFGTRIKALENLGKVGTETAAKNIIQIATNETGEYKDSYIFTAYQALQDTNVPIAIDFLKQELNKLTHKKQQWRN